MNATERRVQAAVALVCKTFEARAIDVMAKGKFQPAGIARSVAMALSMDAFKLSSSEVGHVFNRSPEAVRYAAKRFRSNEHYQRLLSTLKADFPHG